MIEAIFLFRISDGPSSVAAERCASASGVGMIQKGAMRKCEFLARDSTQLSEQLNDANQDATGGHKIHRHEKRKITSNQKVF